MYVVSYVSLRVMFVAMLPVCSWQMSWAEVLDPTTMARRPRQAAPPGYFDECICS